MNILKRSILVIATALLTALVFVQPVLAQQPQGGDQVDQLAAALGLSEEQQAEIRAVIEDLGPQIEALQQRSDQVQADLRGEVGHDYDEAAIRSRAAQLGELTGEMTSLSLLLQSKVQAVFSPEQREELERQAEQQRQMQEEMMRQQFQQQQQQGGMPPQ